MSDNNASPPPDKHSAPARERLSGAMKAVLAVMLICSIAAVGLSGASLVVALKPRQQGETQSVDFAAQTRAYIESHPEVLVDSLNRAESVQKETEAKTVLETLKTERDEIFKEYNQLRQQIRGYEELLSREQNIL